MNIDQVKSEIITLHDSIFPESFISFSNGSFSGSLCVTFATSKTWVNNIIHNDFGHSQIWFHDCFDKNGENINGFTLDSSYVGFKNYNNGFKSKCGFRKINKPVEFDKIKKVFEKFFTEMKFCSENHGRG